MLIGLNGFKNSGKDTVGNILVDKYDFKKIAFADKIKESASALFGVPIEKWDEWKNDDKIFISVFKSGENIWTPSKNFEQWIFSARTFLQRYGTESHRDIFGENFWIDYALKDINKLDNFVITDCRLENELKVIRDLGGSTIKIIRETNNPKDTHITELEPNTKFIDYVLYNNGTLIDLEKTVDEIVVLLTT